MNVWAGDQNTHGMTIRFTDARGEQHVETFKTFGEWHKRASELTLANLRQEPVTVADGRQVPTPFMAYCDNMIWAAADTYVPPGEKKKGAKGRAAEE